MQRHAQRERERGGGEADQAGVELDALRRPR